MLIQEIIRRKRDGKPLEQAEIDAFATGLADGTVTDAQASALAMAIFFRGMAPAERAALTLAMAHSGDIMDWSNAGLDGPVLDKHSTGGVGDKVSLILAPIVAACGGYVPMISGRGLGHTGGTLDKLDAIPGYRSLPDNDTFARAVKNAGCAIIGATGNLAPADKRLYAIRDTTGTVESLDLITASILSKKLASGLDGLVMDVKFGNGAFMAAFEDAEQLAESIVDVANDAGLPTVALMTDMNEALGRTAGNALETAEAIAALRGDNPDPRLMAVTRALAAELIVLGQLAPDTETAGRMIDAVLADGRAADHFGRMVATLGGPADLIDRPADHLTAAPVAVPVAPADTGIVATVDTRALGLAVVALGGGRRRPEDTVDHRVGLSEIAGIGESVAPDGAPLAVVHAADETAAAEAARAVAAAFTVGAKGRESAPQRGPLVARRLPRLLA
ncbi:thymidine phosphorylase [Fodinicurvata sp. EGI_FJ10296]|uniref:thymidine phosphorylase n=1 Tax=Fodinicurvata sp. EGI_FJ10296 TaxID=3231908 RepID=UPI0034538D4E